VTDYPFSLGETLGNKYRIDEIVGQGGMGVVVAAWHAELEQRVAIKFLLPQVAQHAVSAERFRREARAAVKIQSQHVARVFDVGTLEGGIPFMVMEYLQGNDLSDVLLRDQRLSPEMAVDYVLQACEAIAEAHAVGIVHRDLKPANLFLAARSDGTQMIKVLDFGISKSLGPGSSDYALTGTQSMMGSPQYMSPEQLRSSRDVDAGADIWSLGVILFELTTGVPPFQAETMPQLCTAILESEPLSFASQGVQAPAVLEAAVQRCLQKDRAHRFRSVAELGAALASVAPAHSSVSVARMTRLAAQSMDISITTGPAVSAGGSVVSATPAGVETSRTEFASSPALPAPNFSATPGQGPNLPPPTNQGTVNSWGNTAPRESRRGRGVLVLITALLALGAMGLTVVLTRPPEPEPATGMAAEPPQAAPELPAEPEAPAAVSAQPAEVASAEPEADSEEPEAEPEVADPEVLAKPVAPGPTVTPAAKRVPSPRVRRTPSPAPRPATPKPSLTDDFGGRE
jgi:serine/threonine-protein kinase